MMKFIRKQRTKILSILGVMICFFTITSYLYFSSNQALNKNELTKDIDVLTYYSTRIDGALEGYKEYYLSDLVPIQSSVGYDELRIDTNMEGTPIILKLENNYFSFKKGLFAHATSTLVYDISEYDEYKYFTTFIGLNNTSGRGNGVIYHFYTSPDNATWTEYGEPIAKLPLEEATFVSIPLENVKYIKLVADSNGSNAADHSVYADAKLVTEVNGNFVLEPLEQIDAEVKSKYNGQAVIDEELEYSILKRSLVKKVGQYTLNSFYNESEDHVRTLNWLLDNPDVLKFYVLGGNPDGGNYYNSLSILSKLYKEYASDFENTDLLNNPTYPTMTYGELYKKMAVSIALTHSQRVGLWMQNSANGENNADPLRRYAIYKYMHKNNMFKITESMDMTHTFEDLHIQEMRILISNSIDDEEILWLNRYVQDNVDRNPNNVWRYTTPHPYIAYVWPNYSNDVYYDPANVDYFNALFAIDKTDDNVGTELLDENGLATGKVGLFDSEFVIPGGENVAEYRLKISRGTRDYKLYKVWMNFRNKFGTGAVCGGISKSGHNIRGTHGIPATVIGQPGHAALLFYSKDAEGRGFWRIDNDVSGWTLSGGGGRLLGWGSGSYASGYSNGVYVELEQAAINDYQNLTIAEELIMLADVYSDSTTKETLYRKALETQSINFDAWLGLINLYNASNNKTEDEIYDLAVEMAEELKYFPLPMYNATSLLKSNVTSVESIYKFTLLQTRILKEAQNTPNNTAESFTVVQPGVTRLEASYLLGIVDNSIATFAFDGDDAGKIVLSSRFDNSGIRWDYSLDGKHTWIPVEYAAEEEHKLKLTSDQIASITSENDIYVHIVGVDYEEENLYKIDITEGSLPADIFANDLENRVVGVNLNTEWRYSDNDDWTLYSISSPDLTGDKTIQVRQSATGTTLASNSVVYTFTEDNQPDTRKYIPVSHIQVVGVSTEAVNQGGAASKSIDGNYNTRYHSAWNGTDTERYITFKLDRSVTLSAVEFVPAGGGNGKIYDGTVYGSMDGENWEVLSTLTNLRYTNQANTNEEAIANTKSFDIEDEKEVQYVKIVADRTNGNWFTAREFNFYQDLTKNPHPTAGIGYSTTELTNNKVVARLINPSRKITITNNDGSDTYVFSENGEFTFEFVDEFGATGSATAKVTWIDNDIPDADINYELDNNHKISISLDDITEDVYLLDEHDRPINYIEVKDKKVTSVSYLNSAGQIYKTVYIDENGCITKVQYFNTNPDITSVTIYETIIENGVIAGEVYYDSEGSIVEPSDEEKLVLQGLQQPMTDPLEYTFEDNGSHEFKLRDKANNVTYKSVKVDYEDSTDTILTSDITYDITHLTNKSVSAIIKPYVFNSDGTKDAAELVDCDSIHVFDNNGSFKFKYRDPNETDLDNVKTHTARVNWIDKTAPTAEVEYSKNASGEIVARLVNESEQIIILNNGFSREYIFKDNGEFTFKFEDLAGNVGQATAKVDSFKEEENKPDPVEPNIPDTPSEPVNPSDPDPTSPSTPSNNVTPVIPYTPNRPNRGQNTSNNASSTEKDNEVDSSSNDSNPEEEKPNDTDKEDPSKDIEEDEEKPIDNRNKIKLVLIAAVIILSIVTANVYLKKRQERND